MQPTMRDDPSPRMTVAFDHHTATWVQHPYAVYRRLRDDAPLAWSESHGGFWILSRYDDVSAALRDWVTFASGHAGRIAIPNTGGSVASIPLEVDPPRHEAYREVVAPFFTRAAVAPLEGAVRARAAALLAGALAAGRCEAVTAFAAPLLADALARFFGLPLGDVARIERWADAIFAGRVRDPDGAVRANAELNDYVAQQFEERRREPRDDDVFSAMVQADVEGAPMSDAELVGFGRTLLLAGREATIDALTGAMHHLAEHPEALGALRSAAAAERFVAIEELIRFVSPIQMLGRVASRDVELHGQTIRAGESVAMAYGSANRDEQRFEAPESCRLTRRPNPHLAFGAGPHHCLGANLARLVLRVAFDALVDDVAAVRLDPVDPPQRKLNGDARGFVRLGVLLEARGAS